MKNDMLDRINAVLCYYTFGIFALVLIVFCSFCSKKLSPVLMFHIIQSVFISILLACISAIYYFLFSVVIDLPFKIPFLQNALVGFDVFMNRTPVLFGFTLSGFFVFLVITYLSIFALLGKKSYLPVISDIVKANRSIE